MIHTVEFTTINDKTSLRNRTNATAKDNIITLNNYPLTNDQIKNLHDQGVLIKNSSNMDIIDLDLYNVKRCFTPVNKDGQIIYYCNRGNGIRYKYSYFYKILKTKVNLYELLGKQEGKETIKDDDLIKAEKLIYEDYRWIFRHTFLGYLNRIDYKFDFHTPHKKLYLKLLKKSVDSYKRLKKHNYPSSLYYKSNSVNINIYDKMEQLQDINKENIKEEYFENLLRFEVQVKSNKLKSNLHNEGITRELHNYFSQVDRDYYINDTLKNIIYSGDYYSLERATTILRHKYSDIWVEKLVKFLKLIRDTSITAVKEQYNNTTFNNYINKLSDAEINPITIPKNTKPTYLKNIFKFTDKNIYLLDNYSLVVA